MLEDFKNSQGVKASSSKKFREALSIIECPRDAMQGWHNFIATEKK